MNFTSPYVILAAVAVILAVLFIALARRADGSPYVRLAVPTLLLQVLYPDSRKVGFGWALFVIASLAAFLLRIPVAAPNGAVASSPLIDAQTWLLCVFAASALIGGGTIADAKHDLEMAKLGAAAPEVKTDAPAA